MMDIPLLPQLEQIKQFTAVQHTGFVDRGYRGHEVKTLKFLSQVRSEAYSKGIKKRIKTAVSDRSRETLGHTAVKTMAAFRPLLPHQGAVGGY